MINPEPDEVFIADGYYNLQDLFFFMIEIIKNNVATNQNNSGNSRVPAENQNEENTK